MLSCSCEYGGEWYYIPSNKIKPFPVGRRKPCCSCHRLINITEDTIELSRFRDPYTTIEAAIWGDSVQLASWFLCEQCSEIYLNLDAIGYCYFAGDDIRENLRDYWDITGFEPKGDID